MDKEKDNLSSSDETASEDGEYEIFCNLCKTGFSGTVPYRQHLKGSKHKKAETKQFMKEKYGQQYLNALKKLKNSDASDSTVEPTVTENEEDALVFTCHLCKKVCTGNLPYELHLASRQHLKQVRKKKLMESLTNAEQEISSEKNAVYEILPQLKPFATCTTCKKPFSGPESYKQHLESTSHRKELQKLDLLKNLKQDGVLDPDEDHISTEMETGIITCKTCEKSFSGPIPYQSHLLSDMHKHKTEDLQLMEKLKDMMVADEDGSIHCTECGKVFSGPKPLYQHITGPAHAKKNKRDALSKDLLTKYPEFMKESSKPEDQEDDSDSDVELLVCTICHKSFSGPEPASEHFRSKKHLKAKKEKLLVEKIKKQKKKDSAMGVKTTASGVTNGDHPDSAATPQNTKSNTKTTMKVKKRVDSGSQDDFELI